MATLRSGDDLHEARRGLFGQFPREPSPAAAFSYQVALSAEIRKTEAEQDIEKNSDRAAHLHSVRRYGDALAMIHLSEYARRQLARNPGNPAHLLGQAAAFDFTLESARQFSEQGVPTLLADLTNILRIGDIVVCTNPNSPTLVECKSGVSKTIKFGRQGRRGRQLARMESVTAFLTKGRGVIFGESAERRTVMVTVEREYRHDLIDELVTAALNHVPTVRLVEPDDLLAVSLFGERLPDVRPAIEKWRLPRGARFVTGSSLDLLTGLWPDISPPILWAISADSQWALMEGDVSITHAVRLEGLIGLRRNRSSIRSVSKGTGQFPWFCEIEVGGDVLTVGANVLREVIYTHETLSSAGQRLLEMAENLPALLEEPDIPS